MSSHLRVNAPLLPLRSRRLTSTALGLLLLTALPACVNGKGNSYSPAEQEIAETLTTQLYAPRTAEQREAIETQDLFAQAAFWSREYDLNPGDLESAIKLSSALRRMGNPQQAMEISQQARAMFPRDTDLIAELAGALIAMERGKEAIAPLAQATRYNPNNARLWSLMGASYDQMEQYSRAREFYSKALALAPNDSNVLANVGLSYALEGNARTAEVWLRRAAADPNASAGIRQNLALVLGLQGKYAEAETLARQDLDPEGAENNLAYLRSLKGSDRSYEAVSEPQSAPSTPRQAQRQYPTQPRQQPYAQRPQSQHSNQQQAAQHRQTQHRQPNQRQDMVKAHGSYAAQPQQRRAQQAQMQTQAHMQAQARRRAPSQSAQTNPQARNRFIPPQAHTAEQQAVLAQIARSLTPGQSKTVPIETQIRPAQGGVNPTAPQQQTTGRVMRPSEQTTVNTQQPHLVGYPQPQYNTAPQNRRAPLRRRSE